MSGAARTDRADGKPGHYYVTMQDRGRTALLVGPFTQTRFDGTTKHAQALGNVRHVRRYIVQHYPNLAFATFGTSRLELDVKAPIGKLGRTKVKETNR